MEKGQKTYFIITVDTESDNAWTSSEHIKLKNFEEIPRFQELCEKYHIKPTYLLTYEYATYLPAVDYLKPKADSGLCEIGHHLHTWTTPPFQNEKNGIDIDWIHSWQFQLPDDLFYKKADQLKQAIMESFGKQPKVHRAGKWGIDQRTINWLIKNDFVVDTSVVPLRIYRNNYNATLSVKSSFHPLKSDIYQWKSTENNYALFEIPLTISKKNNLISQMLIRNINNCFLEYYSKKILNRLGVGEMFRPYPYKNEKFYQNYFKAMNSGIRIFNFMLHSSELALNCSPFTENERNYQSVWKALEFVFKNVNNNSIRSVKASELPDLYYINTQD